ncbi:hypothetical protein Back11_56920 [Paenibacillus baekrokdamisoli]|uniref:Uncharacterized protein n=1 Tax=Paenibacillus baekrokdamisoli TaxID=1712516 RepID=A0A3G9IZI2_9BACL|nr:hypothetical protein [Paenibacillus baekrokdamisoli]MBB3073431.1 hypothetical protein [Paenibacillus baekrokdamisoli]BBH24347.1 hypothetical protein Back11_56920 [Paenibacillus baekrokdamisoli]
MKESFSDTPTTRIQLDNYGFAGMDASQLGAIKSAADYYQIPVTATQIYGMTGLAFLFVIDENLVQPNAGPPEPEIFRLARNIGLEIEGFHQYAEGVTFSKLQSEAWEKARMAINSNKPVFAKNLGQDNQTSVIIAYDSIGYYIDSWHTGYEHSQEVIPWNLLGLVHCPCMNCANERKIAEPRDSTSGLISLHWADTAPSLDEMTAFKEALQFAIRLNDDGSYKWSGKMYFVGSRAFEEWINGFERNNVYKFDFALIIEVVNEARYQAILFLADIKDKLNGKLKQSVDEAIMTYTEISSRCNTLKSRFPYEQPRELFNDTETEDIIAILREISMLERKALTYLKEMYVALS